MRTKSQQLDWLQNEVNKDKIELDKEKIDFIKEIKELNKEILFNKKEKKLTFWQKIKKVIFG